MSFIHIPSDTATTDLVSKNYRGQRWYQSPNGVWYPSITTVLSNTGDKTGLDAWRASIGALEADKHTKRSTDRGTAVHDMCEKMLKNVDNPTDGHDRDHIQSFNRLKIYLKKINNIRYQEQAMFSDVLRVAGRVDLIADFQGTLSVVDFKTSTKSKQDDQLLDYYIQETFYALACLEMYGIEIRDIVTVMTIESEAIPTIKRKTIDRYVPLLLKRVSEFEQRFKKTYELMNQ